MACVCLLNFWCQKNFLTNGLRNRKYIMEIYVWISRYPLKYQESLMSIKRHFRLLWMCCLSLKRIHVFCICYLLTIQRGSCTPGYRTVLTVPLLMFYMKEGVENKTFAIRNAKSKLISPIPSRLWTYWAVLSNSDKRNLTWKASICSFLEGLQFCSTLGKIFYCQLSPQEHQKVLMWASWMPWV